MVHATTAAAGRRYSRRDRQLPRCSWHHSTIALLPKRWPVPATRNSPALESDSSSSALALRAAGRPVLRVKRKVTATQCPSSIAGSRSKSFGRAPCLATKAATHLRFLRRGCPWPVAQRSLLPRPKRAACMSYATMQAHLRPPELSYPRPDKLVRGPASGTRTVQ